MSKQSTLRGMATAKYEADDVKAAAKWYSEFLGVEPYFHRPDPENPAYVEFRLGDYQAEFGIADRKYAPKAAKAGPGGVVLYWHVDNLEAVLKKAIAMGATEYDPITDRGAGFITASVIDPFGNVVGFMHNPHYLEILESVR